MMINTESRQKRIWDIFLIYIAISPLADILFGLCQYMNVEMSININHIFRLLGLGFIFLLICNNKKYTAIFMLYSMWIVIGVITTNVKEISLDIVTDISWNLKMLTALGIFLLVLNVSRREWFDIKKVFNMLCIAALISAISIIPSIFGFGFRTYGSEAWGYKGFFYTNNTISIFLLMIYPIIFVLYKGKRLIVSAAICFFSLILIGTKTALLGGIAISVLMILLYLYYNTEISQKIKEPKYRKLILGVVSLLIIVGCLCLIVVGIKLYDKYQQSPWYDSFADFIISNRSFQLELIKGCLDSERNIFTNLFGFGYSRIESEYASKEVYHAIEMDIQGIYYNFGVIVLIAVLAILIITIYKAVKILLRNRNIWNLTILLIFILGVFHSIFAGHVMYEALSQLPFWIVVGYINILYEDMGNEMRKSEDKI